MMDCYKIGFETMREVQLYRTERGLLKALDNGGRFFNVFTKAGDDQITRSELAKAARADGSSLSARDQDLGSTFGSRGVFPI